MFFFKTHEVKDDNWPLTQNIVGALLTREWFDMMDECLVPENQTLSRNYCKSRQKLFSPRKLPEIANTFSNGIFFQKYVHLLL